METSDIAVDVKDVSKIYRLYNKPVDRLKEALSWSGRKLHTEFRAVDGVGLTIRRGETVGIIGKNGSGKSTLLKMITGVLTPSAGKITVNGKISALLELGAGFNPEYTGIENIYLNGSVMGYTKEEVDTKLDGILAFADIGDFVHQPVKLYSSGMYVRLAFAVAIHVDPDILIVDEALSVGDVRFQQKCFRKIDEFKRNKTIIVVSHDMAVINNYCDRAFWINEGRLMAEGHPLEIAKQYQAYMIDSSLSSVEEQLHLRLENVGGKGGVLADPLPPNLDVLGDKKVTISGIALRDAETEESIVVVPPGRTLKLYIEARANESIGSPIVGFTMKDRLGNIVAQSNSFALDKRIQAMGLGTSRLFCFEFTLPYLNKGQYTISPAIASGTQEEHTQHCWIHDAIVFNVLMQDRYNLEGYLILNEVDFYQME